MSLVISKVFTYDTDAGNYIQAVEAADGQALETGTRQAINNFVVGCKQDGIWNAIKASCILSGARTLSGALIPLAGTAPANNGFIGLGTDYVRKTGLVGNGTSKYLNSNRNNNSDPQNSFHLSVYVSANGPDNSVYIGLREDSGSSAQSEIYPAAGQVNFRTRVNSNQLLGLNTATGFLAANRSTSTTQTARITGSTYSASLTSVVTQALPLFVFARAVGLTSTPSNYSSARLAFYSIGESLDLALLDARVTALITAFGVAIP